ncbi:hypothetical protein OCU04_008248 [Sclerotinia nivalis]|uniref:Uncharacterized protein n=1 Tax=Sclerotinia nivalis TaxID=352851 RepID=A0A9X0DJH5_9HELO|nr:hypothetical protein OCU04_008248 [Sclerotinia nivalis]
MFCKTCTDLFLAIGQSVSDDCIQGTFKHHASSGALKKAASISCRLCKRVYWHKYFKSLRDGHKEFRIAYNWHSYETHTARISITVVLEKLPEHNMPPNTYRVSWDLVPVEPSEGRVTH